MLSLKIQLYVFIEFKLFSVMQFTVFLWWA